MRSGGCPLYKYNKLTNDFPCFKYSAVFNYNHLDVFRWNWITFFLALTRNIFWSFYFICAHNYYTSSLIRLWSLDPLDQKKQILSKIRAYFIRSHRMQWLGHNVRSSRYSHDILEEKPICKRSLGRHRVGWLDGILQDLALIKQVDVWQEKSFDRMMWRVFTRKLKARNES